MLLEAVPNLSLGPDDPALDAILEDLTTNQTPAWKLLDTHADPDHNRTVLTIAGAPAPLRRALETLIDASAEHATLEGHHGVHPRIGLLDVIPIVPLAHAREADAQRIARDTADHLAHRHIPTFFYARLTPQPSPTSLAQIRKETPWGGEPVRLPRTPDLGPSRFHPHLGATCIGTRDPLVAYNVILDTRNLEAGQRIARELRATNGGLPGVQALAFPLASRQNRVQVSTNIKDIQRTRIEDVYTNIRSQAADRDIGVLEGELVGLAPRLALSDQPQRMGLEASPKALEEHLQEHGLPSEIPGLTH